MPNKQVEYKVAAITLQNRKQKSTFLGPLFQAVIESTTTQTAQDD